MLGFEARGNLEYPEKTSWSERETLQQTRTTHTTQGRFQDSGTQATVVGVEGSVEIASCMGGSGFAFSEMNAGLFAGNLTIE